MTSYSRVQVTSLVTCEVGPCVNNGTCVPTAEGSGFECRCPPVPLGAAPLGPNCELRRPCDQRDACRSDAGVCHETVVNETTVVHECLCLPGFFGARCENDVRLTTTAAQSIPVTGYHSQSFILLTEMFLPRYTSLPEQDLEELVEQLKWSAITCF